MPARTMKTFIVTTSTGREVEYYCRTPVELFDRILRSRSFKQFRMINVRIRRGDVLRATLATIGEGDSLESIDAACGLAFATRDDVRRKFENAAEVESARREGRSLMGVR